MNIVKLLIICFVFSSALFIPKTAEASFVDLCHKTGNGYIYLVVALNAKQSHLNHGDFEYDGPSYSDEDSEVKRLLFKSRWCNSNDSTPSPSPSVSPTASASATPAPTPTATPSASPKNSPTATPSASPRTDVSDGRSDGKTDSLGCLSPSDKCGVQASSGDLPKTGSNTVEAAGVLGLLGITLKLITRLKLE